jgi:hypothetical protein
LYQVSESRPHGFKEEADIFEAVIGGLYEDCNGDDAGWKTLQQWFDRLAIPWVDWFMEKLDGWRKDKFLTFNRIPLANKKKRKILVPTGPRGSAADTGRPTLTPPLKPVQVSVYDCKALTSSAAHS